MERHGIHPLLGQKVALALERIPPELLDTLRQHARDHPSSPSSVLDGLGVCLSTAVQGWIERHCKYNPPIDVDALHRLCQTAPASYLRALLLVDRPLDVLLGSKECTSEEADMVRCALEAMIKWYIDVTLLFEVHLLERGCFLFESGALIPMIEANAANVFLGRVDSGPCSPSTREKLYSATTMRMKPYIQDVWRAYTFPSIGILDAELDTLYVFGEPVLSRVRQLHTSKHAFVNMLLKRLGSNLRLHCFTYKNGIHCMCLAVADSETEGLVMLGQEVTRTALFTQARALFQDLGRLCVARSTAIRQISRTKWTEESARAAGYRHIALKIINMFPSEEEAVDYMTSRYLQTLAQCDGAGRAFFAYTFPDMEDAVVMRALARYPAICQLTHLVIDMYQGSSEQRGWLDLLLATDSQHQQALLLEYVVDHWNRDSHVDSVVVLAVFAAATTNGVVSVERLQSLCHHVAGILSQSLRMLVHKTKTLVKSIDYRDGYQFMTYDDMLSGLLASLGTRYKYNPEEHALTECLAYLVREHDAEVGHAKARMEVELVAVVHTSLDDVLDACIADNPDLAQILPRIKPPTSWGELDACASRLFKAISALWEQH